MENRRNARDYQVERRKKSALSLQKWRKNARSFFNINALLDAASRSRASKLIEKIARDQ
jgi:hypothetical protein